MIDDGRRFVIESAQVGRPPVDDLAEAVKPEIRWTGAAHAVAARARVADEAAGDVLDHQRRVDLFRLLDVAAQVALGVDDERRRLMGGARQRRARG